MCNRTYLWHEFLVFMGLLWSWWSAIRFTLLGLIMYVGSFDAEVELAASTD